MFPVVALAEPNATQKEAARNLMWSGDQLFEKGDHARALQAYLAADAIMNVPTTGLAVARAHAALGQLVEARDKALLVARSAPQPRESTILAEARGAAAKLADGLGPRIPTVRLQIDGPPPDAAVEVTIDGVKVPTAGLAEGRELNPTSHEIVVTATGFEDAARSVKLAEGESRTVQITLQRKRVAPAEPRASVVTMATGFGVAGAAFIVGAITGAVSITETDALLEQCGGPRCGPDKADELSAATTLANVSNGAFVVGGVGVIAGIVGVVLFATEPSAAGSELVPKPSARGLSWVFH
jgi:hypothetical protein